MQRFFSVLIALSLITGGATLADEPLPKQDAGLARALTNHPDIVAAKAKIALADAELYGKRIEVSRQVLEHYASLKLLDAQIVAAKAGLAKSKQVAATGAMTTAELQSAEAQLVEAITRREHAETELRLLIGTATPAVEAATASKPSTMAREMPQGPILDKAKTALAAPIKLDFVETPLMEVMAILSENKSGVMFSLQMPALENEGIPGDEPVTLLTNEVRLRDALQAFEDTFTNLQFVLRDYGILLTTREYAASHGYVPVLELLREPADAARDR